NSRSKRTKAIMAEISAAAVKALREKTGAGMMECKKALIEAGGNEERANEILRERGLASAKKKEGRVAAEGVVGSYIHMGGKVGEGRLGKFYEEFVLLDQPFIKDPAKTVGELVTEKIAKTGEKISIRRFARYKMGEGLTKREDDFGDEVAKLAEG